MPCATQFMFQFVFGSSLSRTRSSSWSKGTWSLLFTIIINYLYPPTLIYPGRAPRHGLRASCMKPNTTSRHAEMEEAQPIGRAQPSPEDNAEKAQPTLVAIFCPYGRQRRKSGHSQPSTQFFALMGGRDGREGRSLRFPCWAKPRCPN